MMLTLGHYITPILITFFITLGVLIWILNTKKLYAGKNKAGNGFLILSILFIIIVGFLPFLYSPNNNINIVDVILSISKETNTYFLKISGMATVIFILLVGYIQKRAYRHGVAILLVMAFLFAYSTQFVFDAADAIFYVVSHSSMRPSFSYFSLVHIALYVIFGMTYVIHSIIYLRNTKTEPISITETSAPPKE